MTVTVSFITPGAFGAYAAGGAGIGACRAQERLTIPATTTTVALAGEIVLIGNGEAGMVAVAFGTTPDAAATADSSPVTTAGIPVSAGSVGVPLKCPAGAKINVKAIP